MALGITATETFLADVGQEVRERAESDDLMLPAAFTTWAMEAIEDAGEFEEGVMAWHRDRGMEISGYAINDEATVVDLVVSSYRTRQEIQTEPKADVEAAVKRLFNFYNKSCDGLYERLEESSSAFDLALELHAIALGVQQLRLIFVTDGIVRSDIAPPGELDGASVTVDVWDIERLHRLVSSGRRQEPIRVDIQERFGEGWPCLEAPGTGDDDYSVYLALVPGRELAEIYDTFGPRLLELNVRAFLQARGKVNKGIRDTLINEPGRFLAYNNGITATASKLRITGEGGQRQIAEIEDLQIVNGGQTSASLHRAFVKEEGELDDVLVQAKITVVHDLESLHELVPLVSRYSNSQNKVSEADFSANDTFHVRIEELSRSIWAPAAEGGSLQTRWFYERARGQYQDAIGREPTPARRKRFRRDHPSSQKFTKTDLAKFEHTWSQLPHIVSLGAQKNFLRFQTALGERRNDEPDERYFQLLIAKAILFRSSERIVRDLKLGGYRANVVTYSLALLNLWSENRIDLERIWRVQKLTEVLESQIRRTAIQVFGALTDPPDGGNVTEWAKKEACWKRIQQLPRDVDDRFWTELAPVRQDTLVLDGAASEARKGSLLLDSLSSVETEALFALQVWGRSSGMKPLDQRIVQNVAIALADDKRPARRDGERVDSIIRRSVAEGFAHEGLGPYRT